MIVKVKKVHSEAVIPKYAKEGDAGLDLTAVSFKVLDTGAIEYDTGLQFEIPKGYVGLVFPRSSIHKHPLRMANSVGVVDSGYRGNMLCTFHITDATNDEMAPYNVGDRVAQLIIVPYPEIELEEVETLSETERGDGKYGSSGK